jgi:hypothetical protein
VGGAYEESVGAITTSGSGRIYLSGAFGNAPAGIVATADFDPDPAAAHWLTSAGGNDAFVLALSSDGTFLWVHQKGTANGEAAGPITTDGNGNVIFAGSANNLFFVEKIDSDKKLMWSLDFGLPQIFSITTDPAGNILLAGGFGGTQDLDPGTGVKKFTASSVQDGFNEKLDANGSLVWATHIRANGSATSIISDASGNIYTTGHYGATGGNIDFDPSPGTFNLKTNGRAMYIQKLSGAGAFLWAGQVSGDSKSKAFSRGILVNSSNDVITQFEFSGTVDVDPGSATVSLKAVGSQDKVLQVLRQATTTPHIVIKRNNSAESLMPEQISVFPIPNNGRFFIQTPAVGARAQWLVYDIAGRVLGRGTFDGTISQRLPISLFARPSSTYVVEVRGSSGKYVTRVAVN